MQLRTLAYTLLFCATASGTPLARQNVPITEAEWNALKESGLVARSQNVPITQAEWDALEENGFLDHEVRSLQRRDEVKNCGKDITGKRSIGGNHVGWVPLDQFKAAAQIFCASYTGTDIAKGHESSDTYGVTLTNQDDPTIPGAPGQVVFAIYNTSREPTFVVDDETCLRAMEAPIIAYLSNKKKHKNGKGDKCYGSKNEDYEGGYYKVEGIGAFGSEVSKV